MADARVDIEEALKDALDSGKVAGAALDVFAVEPAKENALFGHPRVICTPHLGASTTEAQENVALQVAEQMSDYLLTGAVTNAINAPAHSTGNAYHRINTNGTVVACDGGCAPGTVWPVTWYYTISATSVENR